MAFSATLQLYRDRAEQARQEAEAATLDHVRDRCLRSEAAWTAMADRAAQTEDMRAKQALAKAAQPPE
jgi:hypothetical protein